MGGIPVNDIIKQVIGISFWRNWLRIRCVVKSII